MSHSILFEYFSKDDFEKIYDEFFSNFCDIEWYPYICIFADKKFFWKYYFLHAMFEHYQDEKYWKLLLDHNAIKPNDIVRILLKVDVKRFEKYLTECCEFFTERDITILKSFYIKRFNELSALRIEDFKDEDRFKKLTEYLEKLNIIKKAFH